MRTTLSMSQDTLRQAKSLAARSGETLSAFVESAIREKLRKVDDTSSREGKPLLFVPHEPGTLVPIDVNSNSQLSDLLDTLDETARRERTAQRLAK